MITFAVGIFWEILLPRYAITRSTKASRHLAAVRADLFAHYPPVAGGARYHLRRRDRQGGLRPAPERTFSTLPSPAGHFCSSPIRHRCPATPYGRRWTDSAARRVCPWAPPAASRQSSAPISPGWTHSSAVSREPSGATSALGCLLGAVFLIYTKVASWRIIAGVFLGMLATSLLFNAIGSDINPMYAMPWYWHLVAGGLRFGMVFMATDPVTACMTGRRALGLRDSRSAS